MIKVCEFPGCNRQARFLMCWDNKNGKHCGFVCATHDKELGRTNLAKYMTLEETIVFERYLRETVDLMEYLDFPEWLRLHHEHEKPDREVTELEELNLPPMTYNALYRKQITIDELIDMSEKELIRIRWIGKKGVAEIQKALKGIRG